VITLELKVINGTLWTYMSCENPDNMTEKSVKDLKPKDLEKVNVTSDQCLQLMLHFALVENDVKGALNWFNCYKLRYKQYKESLLFYVIDKEQDRMKENYKKLKKIAKNLTKDLSLVKK
jgi:hypothetical protein